MPSNHLILCHPLLLPSIFSSIRVFSNESVLFIRWPKYWSFSFSISPSSEYSGFISFRTDWLDFLAVQRILKSLLQHHSFRNLQKTLLVIIRKSQQWVHCSESPSPLDGGVHLPQKQGWLSSWQLLGLKRQVPLLFQETAGSSHCWHKQPQTIALTTQL